MTNRRLRVLYLSNAFPPGVTGRFPSLNPSGHATETRFGEALGKLTELKSVGLLPGEVWGNLEPADGSIGLNHELLLWERKPELWHRWRSWRQLRQYYLEEVSRTGPIDVVLVRNLTPVFNCFVRWLRQQRPCPRIVLIFADSSTLGRKMKFSRRLRYAFKPMQIPEERAIGAFDGCISFGIGTREYFESRGIPWLWMPSAFNFYYEPGAAAAQTGPIRFGYFGALAEHASILPTVEVFLKSQLPGTLHICGFGKLSERLRALAAENPSFRFDGLLQNQADCLAWAQRVDVLINPRLPVWGLENSFPSKIFEFGMTGRAILSTRTGGVDEVLREEGFYIESGDFENSLRTKMRELSGMERGELLRRGAVIRERLLKEFTWDVQARRMTEFMEKLVAKPAAGSAS